MSRVGQVINGVQYLSDEAEFESAYLKVREKEERLLGDDLIRMLPHLPQTHRWASEWAVRKYTLYRFEEHLKSLGEDLNVLDIGCGNGWFSNWLLDFGASTVSAVDMNTDELEQGARCFSRTGLQFLYADIFSAEFEHAPFDVITFNASAQYFSDFPALLKRCLQLLKPEGEIHVLDTQFYHQSEVRMAYDRSVQYYTKMGVPEMADHYFHRNFEELESFRWDILYSPNQGFAFIKKIFRVSESPFPWIRIRN